MMAAPTPRTTTDRDRARTSPIGLAAYATRDSAEPYVAQAHHELINAVFMLAVRAAMNPDMESNFRRILLLCPPRSGKSDVVSVYGPAWALATFNTLNIAVIGYAAELAETFSRRARTVLETFGPPVFGVNVDPRSSALDRWGIVDAADTKRPAYAGSYTALGIGGPAMGRGFGVICVDDPVKSAQEAMSQATSATNIAWFLSTARSRLQPGGAIIVAQQRWSSSPQDLAGYLLETEGSILQGGVWLPIILPMEASPLGRQNGLAHSMPDPLNRPLDGGPSSNLWPGRYTAQEIEERKLAKFYWASQFQQAPAVNRGTAVFDPADFLTWSIFGPQAIRLHVRGGPAELAPLASLRTFITVDAASSIKTRADSWAIGLWGTIPGTPRLVLLDMIHGKMEGPRGEQVLETFVARHKPNLVFVETTGELGIAQRLKAKGLPVREFRSREYGDKYTRAQAAVQRFAAGDLFLPASGGPWLTELRDELTGFPLLNHDDTVDMVSMACLVEAPAMRPEIRIIS